MMCSARQISRYSEAGDKAYPEGLLLVFYSKGYALDRRLLDRRRIKEVIVGRTFLKEVSPKPLSKNRLLSRVKWRFQRRLNILR